MFNKGKNSGFHLFLWEYFKENPFSEPSYERLRSVANGKWNNLSKAYREEYRQKSKEMGFEAIDQEVEGIRKHYNDLEKHEKLKELSEIETVNKLLTTIFEGDWSGQEFIFAHVNYMTKVNKSYYPVEVGLVKYSLNDGIIDSLHFHLNPGKIKIGHEQDARFHAENTHQLPIDRSIGISVEHAKEKILGFMSFDQEKTFVLTVTDGEDLKAVKNMFDLTTEQDVIVYPLENLVSKYYLYCMRKKLSQQDAHEKLSVTNSYLHDNIGCDYHSEIDNPLHCSLAKVKRWALQIQFIVLSPIYRFTQL